MLITKSSPKSKEYCENDFENHYQLGHQIGKGAFSVVKFCVHIISGKKMAAKIFNTEKLPVRDFQKIEREVRICRKLKHENIVELCDAIMSKKIFYIILELVSGGELFDDIVARDFYSETDASRCMKQLLSGVAYFHSQKIVHRDLKPENLLLSSKCRGAVLKIADFGLAVESSGSPAWYGLAGTPGYLSPEVVSKVPYSYPVDNWASGVVMYILLAGYPPFWDDTSKGLFKQIKSGIVNFPSPEWDFVSEDAKYIIRNLLNVDSNKRFTAADVLQFPWIANAENITSSIHRQATLNQLKKFNARRKLKVAILSTIFAAKSFKPINKLTSIEKAPKIDDIQVLTNQFINCITDSDQDTFSKLVSKDATLFGIHTGDLLVKAYNYYQSQFKLKIERPHINPYTVTIQSSNVRMLSPVSAVITFVCTVQRLDTNSDEGIRCDRQEHTVVWQKLEGSWLVVHTHISKSSDYTKQMPIE